MMGFRGGAFQCLIRTQLSLPMQPQERNGSIHVPARTFWRALRRALRLKAVTGTAIWQGFGIANWHRIEPFLLEWGPRDPSDARIYALAARNRTVFYTPAVGGGLKQMKDDLNFLAVRMGFCISAGLALKDPSELRPYFRTV
ncbi:hypothetical protein [Sedimentitalea todarodis]|uniref:Uncharacterized protein n=1 Tax=Sedimentitalea todarodis TaxID=1631240 RepID=A0ABU3VM10_9RHOB|nr:hypothetical protein [Sedimentitalea todarodis]MDU9007218.1 hypothetical protein [Sedimentitalea todarodis]